MPDYIRAVSVRTRQSLVFAARPKRKPKVGAILAHFKA
jgi:hypothetical protein